MNSRQKEMLQISLNSEKEILKKIEANYKDALGEIETRIAILKGRADADLQHVIYQIEYQRQLKSQVGSILEQLHNNNFDSVSDYLTTCYEQGFLGTLYDLQGQGIPLIFPIDQEMVVAAIQHETKLSESLYAALGKDTKELSQKIASEISRGFSSNAMYNEIARNLSGYAGISKNNAMRIVRTEGHRIQNKAIAHTQQKAKERGADIVKIWDAALDGKTRPHHRELDGQIRELDEPFVIAGLKAQEPGGFGEPAEDCNCRCRRISKARWLLEEEETKHIGNTDMMSEEELEPIAGKLGITVEALRQYSDEIIPVKARNYEDFKRQYDKIYNYRNTADFKKAQERIIGVKKGKTDVRVRSSAQKELLENVGESSTMTNTDTKAIYDYMSAKSYVVNEKLRTGAMLTEDEKEFVANLDSALDKMPTYEGNLQRSLYFYSEEAINEFLRDYKVGKSVEYKEFLSTTKGEIYNSDGQVQIFIQDAKKGRDIFPFNKEEQEVIYKKNSTFDVLNIVEHDGKHYIILGEKENE